MGDAALALVDGWAADECGGNRSEMLRRLFAEAVEGRRKKTMVEPQRIAWGKGTRT